MNEHGPFIYPAGPHEVVVGNILTVPHFKYLQGQAALSERFMGHQYTEREQLQQQEHIGGVQREDASERTTSANTRQPLEQQYQQLGHRNYSNSDINNFEVIGEEELGGKEESQV